MLQIVCARTSISWVLLAKVSKGVTRSNKGECVQVDWEEELEEEEEGGRKGEEAGGRGERGEIRKGLFD